MKARQKIQFIVGFIIIITMLSFQYGFAQNKRHRIDIMEKQCIEQESNSNTIGMVNCINKAAAEWDKELNKNYHLLMSELSSNSQKKLRLSQRQWLKYRDKEFEFISTFYNELQGSIYSVLFASDRREFIKKRALELKSYHDVIIGDF